MFECKWHFPKELCTSVKNFSVQESNFFDYFQRWHKQKLMKILISHDLAKVFSCAEKQKWQVILVRAYTALSLQTKRRGLREALRGRRGDDQRHQREQHGGDQARAPQHPHARVLRLHHQGRVDRHGLVLQLERRQDAR